MTGWTLPPAGVRRWPFAVGLVITADAGTGTVDTGTADRDRGWDLWVSRRLAVAVAALDAGFFLLTTLEACPGEEAVTGWARLRELAEGTDAQALFVLGAGPVEQGSLEAVATDLRMVVRTVTDDPPDSPDDRTAASGVLAAVPPDDVGPAAGRARSGGGAGDGGDGGELPEAGDPVG